MLDDGRYYVKSDRQVLRGNDPEKWGKQLQDYINSEIRKGNDIVLPTTDGRMVRITERSAYKLADNKTTSLKTHGKTKLSDENYKLKEEAASHIDEIILIGEFSHNQDDIGGYHENDIGEDGFNTYTAYFEDSNGEYYRINFVSALNGDVETAYSIGDIQKRKKLAPGDGSSARESSALNGGKLSAGSVPQNAGGVKGKSFVGNDDSGAEFYDSEPRRSMKVKDKDTLKFLDGQKTLTTYKTMQLIDGKLYPPMAARVNGEYEDASTLGAWEQAVEHPELVKNGNKFKLDKGRGAGSLEAAYNPYMHSSNLVLNDQFSGAYTRDNLVTVECEVPVSEENGSYHAQGAKDATGWHAWHTGTVAGQLRAKKGMERQVFLSRYIKPVRIVPDAEVAQMYKTLLDGTDISVPDNVVTPSLRRELEKTGVPLKKSGRVDYGGKRFSLKKYSEEEMAQHEKDAISHFGKTFRWNETGYLTPNGTKIDFSGRHDGGSGGYRTVDHRDIRERKKPTSDTGSSARESSALNGGKLSDGRIPQDAGNVKEKPAGAFLWTFNMVSLCRHATMGSPVSQSRCSLSHNSR